MTQVFLHNATVIYKDGIQRGGVLVRDGRIVQGFAQQDQPVGLSASETIDLGGAYLGPGLIDIHIHGSVGVDVQATDVEGLRKLSEFLLTEGVTGYFPTLVPTDEMGYNAAIESIASYVDSRQTVGGARVLGIHFEGPFLNEHRCGALQSKHFREYDGDLRSIPMFRVPLKHLMTLAPEVGGALDLTRQLRERGARVFIGHSEADLETLELAVEAGARHITHFPNALAPLHHRKPGVVAWGLFRQDVTLDCIADLHHVHPMMLGLMHQSKGADRMALISDAIMPAGLGDGDFSVWGEKITVRNGRTALARTSGEDTIAGSVITMRQALKNVVTLGTPIHEAVRMASVVPARIAGVDSDRGSIEEGKLAELIAFDDDFVPRLAVVGGSVQRFG